MENKEPKRLRTPKYSNRINMLLNDEQRKFLDDMARKHDVTLSDAIRYCIEAMMEKKGGSR